MSADDVTTLGTPVLVAKATVVRVLVGVATEERASEEGGVMAGDCTNGDRMVRGEPTLCWMGPDGDDRPEV